ncbi:MAG TPA: helix-turn-helix domain-containing protein [Limnochordia bacterium]|nr:helix-turn-helix domain-containing protein [Limnochordia bacterium]
MPVTITARALPSGPWDPAGRSLHRLVDAYGCTLDVLPSSGTAFPHRHSGYELLIVHERPVLLRIGDWFDVLRPGDALLFPAGSLHASRPLLGSYLRTLIHFLPDFAGRHELLERPYAEPQRFHLRPAQSAPIGLATERLRTTALTEGERRRALIHLLDALATAQPVRDESLHPAVRDALACLRVNPDERLTLKALARACCVSEGYLCQLFRSAFGCPPQRLRQFIAIDRVCRQLPTGEQNVAELAAAAGFATRRGLQRAFLRVTGRTIEAYQGELRSRLATGGLTQPTA